MLSQVLETRTIKDRQALLSLYLKNNKIGDLNDHDCSTLIDIFEQFYRQEKYVKFNKKMITRGFIDVDKYGNKCFKIVVKGNEYPCAIKRLAGAKPNEKDCLNRAFRSAIQGQIDDFKRQNSRSFLKVCPLTNKRMESKAEVDHEIPFHVLVEQYLEELNKFSIFTKTEKHIVSCYYDIEEMDYVLDEPYKSDWRSYHKDKAKLRWLSKEANTFAHTLYLNIKK